MKSQNMENKISIPPPRLIFFFSDSFWEQSSQENTKIIMGGEGGGFTPLTILSHWPSGYSYARI